MTGPTVIHEDRVATIETMAALAGCTSRGHLDRRTVPDVVRVDYLGRRLLVGDAKASETAGCSETHRRLRQYFVLATSWLVRGYSVRVALCHSPPIGAWHRGLEADAKVSGLAVLGSGTVVLDGSGVVSWVDVGGGSTMAHPASTLSGRGGSD